MTIRPATQADVDRMVALSAHKRAQYERYAPTFWRRAADADERQAAFFTATLDRDGVVALVHETDGQVDGFIIASIRDAPPVYGPTASVGTGTAICAVDDFCAAPADWRPTASVGRGAALLAEARAEARARGAKLAVVVCGRGDEAKRAMLRGAGFQVASEWYVHPP